MINKKNNALSQISVIHEYIEKSRKHIEKFNEKSDIELINDLLGFLLNPQTAKMIYCLNKVKFSSSYELSNLSSVNFGSLRHYIDDLRCYGIVFEKNQYSKNYEEYLNGWKTISPKASKTTMLCIFNDDFVEVAETFEYLVKHRFKNKEFDKIEERKNILKNLVE